MRISQQNTRQKPIDIEVIGTPPPENICQG